MWIEGRGSCKAALWFEYPNHEMTTGTAGPDCMEPKRGGGAGQGGCRVKIKWGRFYVWEVVNE